MSGIWQSKGIRGRLSPSKTAPLLLLCLAFLSCSSPSDTASRPSKTPPAGPQAPSPKAKKPDKKTAKKPNKAPQKPNPGESLLARKTVQAGLALGGPGVVFPAMQRRANRLLAEKSPYLQQHAWNPVDWYPWGPEAFAKAKRENKPVFLSVGYSTCHWCHVMEKESFESFETAAMLNDHFVCIKLDREERPDIDEYYMATVQEFNNGHGGWPMSVFLTPERQAFVAATYFRPQRFRKVLSWIHTIWTNKDPKIKRKDLFEQAKTVSKRIQEQLKVPTGQAKVQLSSCDQAVKMLRAYLDERYGGLGKRGPKFPQGFSYLFLMRSYHRSGSKEAQAVVKVSLDGMLKGGIYDQLGGGFHRYSTDGQWLVPHFEKMLYDNGLLALTYAEAARLFKDSEYQRVAAETARYLMRDMQLPHGGMASAEDADSEGEEGLFYLWTVAEMKSLLSEDEFKMVRAYCCVTPKGNFSEMPGRSILNAPKHLTTVAAEQGTNLTKAKKLWASARVKLLKARAQRIRPLRDDKVITAWNGLAIAGLASVARLLQDAKMLASAERVAAFLESKLRRDDGRLLRRYRDGEARFLGVLDDYAYFVMGLLELYKASAKTRWLKAAIALEKETRRLFMDQASGVFVRVGKDHKGVALRTRAVADSARPGPAAIAAMNMLRVADLTQDKSLRRQLRALLSRYAGLASKDPMGHLSLLSVFERSLAPSRQIVVVAEAKQKQGQALLASIHKHYDPNAVIILIREQTRAVLPALTKDKTAINGAPTVYLCTNKVCKKPVQKLDDLLKILNNDSQGEKEQK